MTFSSRRDDDDSPSADVERGNDRRQLKPFSIQELSSSTGRRLPLLFSIQAVVHLFAKLLTTYNSCRRLDKEKEKSVCQMSHLSNSSYFIPPLFSFLLLLLQGLIKRREKRPTPSCTRPSLSDRPPIQLQVNRTTVHPLLFSSNTHTPRALSLSLSRSDGETKWRSLMTLNSGR